ncbi:MAG TPA: hypothetical protein DDX92_14215 [Flavobacteriales bacterium]|jgi:amino acid transporter|nr:hypothetical protein [Flavobacteriales bacterium]
MSTAKKFGFFAGVFTPSILTILGVIMYMRMGWVVGNAGLWGTMAIIILAHVISIATGLSISSISTDKKVGAGGVYYVLSRSLGLPMGGAIGLTLFTATSFSIALYLIGFAENFNPVLNLGESIDDYRLSGSIALLLLTLLGYISTSIALRSQYIILISIFLSLLAIFLGDASAVEIPVSTADLDEVPFEVIFGVFFPAVTGFTAGIAMSGDLKNPKRDIPLGTLLAIGTGFVVYTLLALFLYFNVDSQSLRGDNNILMKIAWFMPFVIMGIWGATLSSAMGGILGGPRILQAMSMDRIVPFSAVLSKGSGKNAEPRNALIITIIIAEIGVLIGELDVIARIVSMFYLAAYNFINLSFFLESWASVDFTPSFKVSRWFGAIGFLATFFVMFQLDPVAMIAAYVILFVVFILLRRKEISLSTGDIWGSVWSSVVKAGLRRMDEKEDHQRNWRPNILLFSGGTEARPHLIQLAREIEGKAGMISNFDLHEDPDAKVLFPKHEQSVDDAALRQNGIFARQQSVKDVYVGVETIASTYGFSGIEPNTVLMGWPRKTRNPIRFANMTQSLIDLDYNVLYLDYDLERGFGKYRTIDMWWRGMSHNVTLMLKLSRQLRSSVNWRNAKIRILMVNDQDSDVLLMENRIHEVLAAYRITASVQFIDNADKQPFYELMKKHSQYTDFVFLGIPDHIESEKEYVEKTNELVADIGSTLLVRASSRFDTENLDNIFSTENTEQTQTIPSVLDPLDCTVSPSVDSAVRNLDEALRRANAKFVNDGVQIVSMSYKALLKKYRHEIETFFTTLQDSPDPESFKTAYSHLRERIHVHNDQYTDAVGTVYSTKLEKVVNQWFAVRRHLLRAVPRSTRRSLTESDLQPRQNDTPEALRIKRWKTRHLKWFKKANIRIDFRDLFQFYESSTNLATQKRVLYSLGAAELNFVRHLREQMLRRVDSIHSTLHEHSQLELEDYRHQVNDVLRSLEHYFSEFNADTLNFCNQLDRAMINSSIEVLKRIDVNDHIEDLENKIRPSSRRRYTRQILSYASYWRNNQKLFKNVVNTAFLLTGLQQEIRDVSRRIINDIENRVVLDFQNTIAEIEKLLGRENEYLGEERIESAMLAYNPGALLASCQERLRQYVRILPEKVVLIDEDSINRFRDYQEEEVNQISLDVSRLADFYIELNYLEPVNRGFTSFLNGMSRKYEEIESRMAYFFELSANEQKEDKSELNKLVSMLHDDFDQMQREFLSERDQFFALIEERTEEVSARFRTPLLMDAARNPERYVQFRKRYSGYRQRLRNIPVFISAQREYISEHYKRIRHSLRLARFERTKRNIYSRKNQFTQFVESVKPAPQILTKLPSYYLHLYTGRLLSVKQSSTRKGAELDMALKALNRWKSGETGALLITGDPGMGKSHFVEQVLDSMLGRNVIRVEPPAKGYSPGTSLLRTMALSTGYSGSFAEISRKLPGQSVFILYDLEAWWLRTQGGANHLEKLIGVIEKYGDKHLFILSVNVHAYNIMRQISRLDTVLLESILIPPMDSETLSELIVNRNRFSGIKIKSDINSDEKITNRELRKVIKSVVSFAHGNVSFALNAWLRTVSDVQDNTIEVQPLTKVDVPDSLPHSWAMLLSHIVFHKKLTFSHVEQLFRYHDIKHIQSVIKELERSGVIIKDAVGAYGVEPFVLPYILEMLKAQNYLIRFE